MRGDIRKAAIKTNQDQNNGTRVRGTIVSQHNLWITTANALACDQDMV